MKCCLSGLLDRPCLFVTCSLDRERTVFSGLEALLGSISGSCDVERPVLYTDFRRALEAELSHAGRAREFPGFLLREVNTKGVQCIAMFHFVSQGASIKNVCQALWESVRCGFPPPIHVQRVLPLETVCRADTNSILKGAQMLISRNPHIFGGDGGSFMVPFCVVLEKRLSGNIDSDEIKTQVATLVLRQNSRLDGHIGRFCIDLKNPKVVFLIQILRSLAGLSFVVDYTHYRRGNLQVLHDESVRGG